MYAGLKDRIRFTQNKLNQIFNFGGTTVRPIQKNGYYLFIYDELIPISLSNTLYFGNVAGHAFT